MSDLAHVPGERLQLRPGSTLDEVFTSAVRRGGAHAEPREPLRAECVRSPRELQAIIEEAGIGYSDCGRLSVTLDWWNCNSDDPAWQVANQEGATATA